jgi:hypothetical protein
MAQQWRSFYGSDERFIFAVLRWFRKNAVGEDAKAAFQREMI